MLNSLKRVHLEKRGRWTESSEAAAAAVATTYGGRMENIQPRSRARRLHERFTEFGNGKIAQHAREKKENTTAASQPAPALPVKRAFLCLPISDSPLGSSTTNLFAPKKRGGGSEGRKSGQVAYTPQPRPPQYGKCSPVQPKTPFKLFGLNLTASLFP